MSTYSDMEIIDKVMDASNDITTFYQQNFINYRGITSDTGEYYTEVVAGYLLDHMELFDKINTITREASYKVSGHDGKLENESSNREEERIAIELFKQKRLEGIGEILDYQVPLKNKRSDKGLGKIDLLSYNDNRLIVLELKEPESKETMLRCVLEGYTYSRIFDKEKLLSDYALPANTTVNASPLVFYQGFQHQDIKKQFPKLNQLMTELNSHPYYIVKNSKGYEIIDEY